MKQSGIYIFVYVCMYVCTCICTFVCMYVCTCICTFVNTCTRVNIHGLSRSNHPKCGKCGPHSKKAIYICVCTCTYTYTYSRFAYGVATICRLLKIIGPFCKRALQKRLYSYTYAYSRVAYGVAMISRLPKIIGFFCRISSLLEGSFAKETYTFKKPTNRSHPIESNILNGKVWSSSNETLCI